MADQEEVANIDDVEIEKTPSEEKDDETTPPKYDILVFPVDYTLEILYNKWQRKELVLPKFQRSYVWTKNQASRLIESFMIGLPVPPVFLYLSGDQRHTVVDGHQRLKSIFYFFEGYFKEEDPSGKRQVFKITGINDQSKWFNRSFADFDAPDQRLLKDSVLRAVVIKQLDPKDNTSIYHIFERLNTGGTQLKDQEVRNCVYEGTLNELLEKINSLLQWRMILGKPKSDSRKKDVELVLRYMSLFHNLKNYKKPMKDFLSDFMADNRNPSEDFLESERLRFEATSKVIYEKLGERPFNPVGPLNPSLFDCMYIAVARNLDHIPNDIRERYTNLMANEEFKQAIGGATTDPEVVKRRIKIAEDTLFS